MSQFSFYQQEQAPSPLQHTWHAFRSNLVAVLGLWGLLFFIVITFFGGLVAPHDPLLQDTAAILLPPAWDPTGGITHMLGTDSVGRDLLSRLLHGSQVTFGISVLLVVIAMLVGVAIGALAGLSKGLRSSVLNHLLDSLQAIPTLLIAIIIVAILGTGLVNSMWAIVLALIPQFVHQTRDFVRQEMKKEYVLAAKLDGADKFHIFYNSILPNMVEQLVVSGTLALSTAILDISALGFLSLGAQAPAPELGAMLSEALEVAYISPWSIFLTGGTLFFMLLCVNVVGEGLRSAIRNRLMH